MDHSIKLICMDHKLWKVTDFSRIGSASCSGWSKTTIPTWKRRRRRVPLRSKLLTVSRKQLQSTIYHIRQNYEESLTHLLLAPETIPISIGSREVDGGAHGQILSHYQAKLIRLLQIFALPTPTSPILLDNASCRLKTGRLDVDHGIIEESGMDCGLPDHYHICRSSAEKCGLPCLTSCKTWLVFLAYCSQQSRQEGAFP